MAEYPGEIYRVVSDGYLIKYKSYGCVESGAAVSGAGPGMGLELDLSPHCPPQRASPAPPGPGPSVVRGVCGAPECVPRT